jgi:flagellar hook-length control protein FliK
MPKVASGEVSAMPSSSKVALAVQGATQSFSDLLERANSSPSEMSGAKQNSGQGLAQENHSPVGSPYKRDAKSSDSQSSDAQGHRSAASRALPARPNTLDKAAAVVAAPPTLPPAIRPTLSPSLPWNAGINGSAYATVVSGAVPNEGATSSSALGEESNVNPDLTSKSTLPLTLSEEVVLAGAQPGTTIQDAAILGSANTSDAGTVASVSTNPTGAPVFDLTQFGHKSLPSISLPNPSRGPVEIGDEAHQAKAAVASAPEQVATSPSTVPATLIPLIPTPDPGKIDLGATQGTRYKPATDKSRVAGTQDSWGTTEKTSEVAGSEKSQPGKDWAASFAGTSATDQNTNTTPASAVDLLPSFPITGNQSSPITTDGKGASEVVLPGASDQQPGKLGQSSTGVAEAQTSGETAAVYPSSLVQSAKLVERIGEAELRLGIRAGEFGSVDIRTSMAHNQFTAEISVERGELGRVMAAELSSLQSRLTEQGVPVASITVQNHTGGPSTASDQQNPRGGQQQYAANLVSAREEGPMPMLVPFEGAAPASRLDIHM